MSRTKKIILRVVLGLAGIVAALYIADHTYTAVSNHIYYHDDPVDQIGIPQYPSGHESWDSPGHDCSVSYYFCRVPKPGSFYEDDRFKFQLLGGYKVQHNGSKYTIKNIKLMEFADWKAYVYQINPNRIFGCPSLSSCKREYGNKDNRLTGRLSLKDIYSEEIGWIYSTKGLTDAAIGVISQEFNRSGDVESGEPFISFIYATTVSYDADLEHPEHYHVALIQEKDGRILEVKFEHSCGAELKKDMAQMDLILKTLEIKPASVGVGK